jgi:hypothetical protein
VATGHLDKQIQVLKITMIVGEEHSNVPNRMDQLERVFFPEHIGIASWIESWQGNVDWKKNGFHADLVALPRRNRQTLGSATGVKATRTSRFT